MKTKAKINKFVTKPILKTKIILVIGIVFIVIGTFLVGFSFKKEVLDDKYIIETVTNYKTSQTKELETNELSATRTIKYLKNGIYKLTYTNYSNPNEENLLETGTSFHIVDIYTDSYKLEEDSITINDQKYSLDNNTKDGISINYNNNTLDISIPNTLINKENIIEVNVKLESRDINKKHNISQELYYSFTPSTENEFYNKKAAQSYVIEGNGYMILKEK